MTQNSELWESNLDSKKKKVRIATNSQSRKQNCDIVNSKLGIPRNKLRIVWDEVTFFSLWIVSFHLAVLTSFSELRECKLAIKKKKKSREERNQNSEMLT